MFTQLNAAVLSFSVAVLLPGCCGNWSFICADINGVKAAFSGFFFKSMPLNLT